MQDQNNLIEILEKICQKDVRYKMDAYIFVLTALNRAAEKLNPKRHLTGKELLEAIKQLALEQYGRMSRIVFEHWGITKTEDFGNVVFNMIEVNMLGKTESDSIDDFKNVFDFRDVFEEKFIY